MKQLVGSVIAVEEDPALLATAHEMLGGTSVALVEGPLTEGYSAGAPYDLILIDGAVEFIPEAIIGQLIDGGRIATALLDRGVSRIAIGRRAGQGFGVTPVTDRAASILPGFLKPKTFSF